MDNRTSKLMISHSSAKTRIRHVLLIATLAAAIGIAYLNYRVTTQPVDDPQSASQSDPPVTIGGPFTLIDHNGQIRHDADFRGHYMVIYFGYTYCPDICPFDLRKMTKALDQLNTKGEEIIPIFISIDPERDTQERLADYVDALHPRLIALTGSPQQIAQAASQYRVYYARSDESAPSGDGYLINHSALFYLMGPDGRYITHIPSGANEEQMITTLKSVIDSQPSS